jgi:hypothetical protein
MWYYPRKFYARHHPILDTNMSHATVLLLSRSVPRRRRVLLLLLLLLLLL